MNPIAKSQQLVALIAEAERLIKINQAERAKLCEAMGWDIDSISHPAKNANSPKDSRNGTTIY